MKKIIKLADIEKPKSLNEVELFNMFKEVLLHGLAAPEKVYFYLRMFSKCAELVNADKQLKEIIQNALEKYDNQNLYGFGITVSHRKTFDYAATGSIHYQKLLQNKTAADEELKAYKDFLEKVDSETTNDKEEGTFLKPITFTRMKIVSVGKPHGASSKKAA